MFKKCNKCGSQWATRDQFLSDKAIGVIGYQVFFEDLTLGMFLFNHSCNTTVAVKAEHFLDLYEGPFHTDRKPGDKECPGRCLNENIMSPCSDKCQCAFISKIIEVINNWGAPEELDKS